MTDDDYLARIFDEPSTWGDGTIRLAVRNRIAPGKAAFLLPDGTWKELADGDRIADIGLVLPKASIEAIAAAIQEWQGHTSHADTEARVLREWLAVERARLDDILRMRLTPQ